MRFACLIPGFQTGRSTPVLTCLLGLLVLPCLPVQAQSPLPGDALLQDYFRSRTDRLTNQSLSNIQTAEDWKKHQQTLRHQLQEMLGLSPWPDRGPLQAVVTGQIEQDDFVVENLHFQSLPGLYVTANLYRPRRVEKPAPAILYVCGHATAKKDGVSLGNKTAYQQHGIWFARNGYVCLTIDTIQLGEIEGIHHGTYSMNRWEWLSRGYTPAGVEAWNGIRALDYLQSRPEVDPDRLGVTGRSGGGAYTWFVAALDERIKVAVPVAGITSLKNHVLGGCVEGHCDCMYPVNLYEWDFPQIAALVAPRPLLISNTDKDRIFPLDGVIDVYSRTRRIYELLGAQDHIGLCIAEGGHEDIQQLRNDAFHWFNRFLKNEDPLISIVAEPRFKPQQLRVFQSLPADQRVTTVQDWFIPARSLLSTCKTPKEFTRQVQQARSQILSRNLQTPVESADTPVSKGTWTNRPRGIRLREFQYAAGHPYRLSLFLLDHGPDQAAQQIRIEVLDQPQWELRIQQLKGLFPDLPKKTTAAISDQTDTPLLPNENEIWAFLVPRGIGETAWSGSHEDQTHIRRRFALLGTTLDRIRAEDVVAGLGAIRQITQAPASSMQIEARREAANWVVLGMFLSPLGDENFQRIHLTELPMAPAERAHLLGIEQLLDWNDLLAQTASRSAKMSLSSSSADLKEQYKQSVHAASQSGITQMEILGE